ncbi:MAG: hypothetical protein EXX96DRAFT_346695 [Benjaminiella poitrasii]|nr:MAG: hypothetical protein EXX96DRAFT_346695 [Benjaminiella poitrasii]
MDKSSITFDLPTLEDILSRKTLPPVCLYNFYIVMRDKLQLDHLLDFYLDVRHHEILWRRYAKTVLKKQTETIETPNLFEGLEQTLKTGGTPSMGGTIHSISGCGDAPISHYIDITKPVLPSTHHTPPSITTPSSLTSDDDSHNNSSYTMAPTFVDRHDLSASTQAIVQTYLIPGSPKSLEAVLPAALRQRVIDHYLNVDGTVRHDPMLFAEAKMASFLYMERWAYPTFMRMKVWGNVTERQQAYRLILGLVSLVVAFTVALSFIFLNVPQWGKRFWCMVPFWVGFYQCFVFLSKLDPILVLVFNISETTTFHFNRIAQPQVKHILRIRAIWFLLFSTLVAIILTVILSAITSTRF